MKATALALAFVLCAGYCNAAVDTKSVDSNVLRVETFRMKESLFKGNRSVLGLWVSWGYTFYDKDGEPIEIPDEHEMFNSTTEPALPEPVQFIFDLTFPYLMLTAPLPPIFATAEIGG